jgi:ADP-ribosylglycohydrolase
LQGNCSSRRFAFTYECSIPTHGGQLAICAAAAVACAVAAALEGKSETEVMEATLQSSREAEDFRPLKGKLRSESWQ